MDDIDKEAWLRKHGSFLLLGLRPSPNWKASEQVTGKWITFTGIPFTSNKAFPVEDIFNQVVNALFTHVYVISARKNE